MGKIHKDNVQWMLDHHLSHPNVNRCLFNGAEITYDEMTTKLTDLLLIAEKKGGMIQMEPPPESRHRLNVIEDADGLRIYFGR